MVLNITKTLNPNAAAKFTKRKWRRLTLLLYHDKIYTINLVQLLNKQLSVLDSKDVQIPDNCHKNLTSLVIQSKRPKKFKHSTLFELIKTILDLLKSQYYPYRLNFRYRLDYFTDNPFVDNPFTYKLTSSTTLADGN